MTTHEIIEQLARMECVNYNHYSAPRLCTKAARDRLEELKKDNEMLALAVCSGNPMQVEKMMQERDEARAEVERLKAELHDTIESYKLNNLQPKTIRPEPSRLEIAAMLMAANLSRETNEWDETEASWAVEQADALIAASREAK